MNDLFVQAIGVAGLCAIVLSYQCRSSRNLFICQGVGAVLFCTQFFLLAGYAGMMFNAFGILRAAIFVLEKSGRKWWTLFFLESLVVACSAVAVFCFGEIWYWGLVLLTGMLTSTAVMWRRDGVMIRRAQLAVVSPCWLAYDAFYCSWGGVTAEIFSICSVLISFIRFRKTGFDKA